MNHWMPLSWIYKYKRFKILLCLHVYRPCSSITLQPFRTCWSICLLPHSLHLADTFLPHRYRFLNVGRQSMDALTAKLRTLYGGSYMYMTLLHVRSSCSIDINSRNIPWRSSVRIFFVHVVWNSSQTIPFIFFWSVFHFPSGVFSEAACTISAALTLPTMQPNAGIHCCLNPFDSVLLPAQDTHYRLVRWGVYIQTLFTVYDCWCGPSVRHSQPCLK